jgi:hypothetical protein
MRKQLLNLICIVIIGIFASCAATYKRINPGNLKYPVLERDSIFSYQYHVLRRAGNRKLAKKEDKAHMRVVAVKIYNNTGQTLEYRKNFRIYSGNTEVNLLGPIITSANIKQTAGLHLLYLLLTPMQLNVNSGNSSSSTPIGLVIGPGLALGNMLVASTANKRFKEELLDNDLENRSIANGESFYGLITINDNGFMPLSLRLTN